MNEATIKNIIAKFFKIINTTEGLNKIKVIFNSLYLRNAQFTNFNDRDI